MKRLIIALAAVAATLALAACGGGNSNSSTNTTAGGGANTVSVKSLGGVGNALVDSSGKALYASDQEKGGMVLCDKGCLSFWRPVMAGSGTPTAPASVGKLSLVVRPDGSRQLAANGRLLYTFAEDSPGTAKGNGFRDGFDGQHFTWHVVLAGGRAASSSHSGASNGGYGSGASRYGY